MVQSRVPERFHDATHAAIHDRDLGGVTRHSRVLPFLVGHALPRRRVLVAGGASPGWREDALLDETFVALTAHFFPSAHVFATVFFDFVWVICDSDMCFEDVWGGRG